jgi:hypothetical protein
VPGVRYDYFERSIQAPVNQGTLQPLYDDRSYDKLPPSLGTPFRAAGRGRS